MPTIAFELVALGAIPFAVYFGLKRPLLFPVGLYVMVVPFDALLGTTTTVTRLIGLVTAATLLFSMILKRRIVAPPKSWFAWAAYILLASLSALWTIDASGTALVLGQIVQLFLLYSLLAIYPAERSDVRILGAITVASGSLISVVSLVGYASGFRTQQDRLSITYNGLVLDPNHIAASLLLPIAIAVGTLLDTADYRIRLAACFSTIVMIATLFLTGSRGGLIAVAVMLLYLALKTRFRLRILGLMTVAGFASLLAPTVWDRFADKGLTGGSGREFIWDVGKMAFKDFWLTGAGIGAFPAAYNHELLRTYQPIFQGWSRPAHNAYLSAAVEVGLLGAVLLIHAWWRSWRDAQGNVVIEAAIVGLATASYFLDVLFLKYVWIAFAMAVLVKNAAEPKFLRGGNREPDVGANRQPRPDRRARLLAPSAIRRIRKFAASPIKEVQTANNP